MDCNTNLVDDFPPALAPEYKNLEMVTGGKPNNAGLDAATIIAGRIGQEVSSFFPVLSAAEILFRGGNETPHCKRLICPNKEPPDTGAL